MDMQRLLGSAILLALGTGAYAAEAAAPRFDAATLSGLGIRNIGSAQMSGRIAAIAGLATPDGKTTLYVGAASGGVWKSLDGGTTFKPVFDKQPVQSIGAVTIDPTDPKTVWVGTGETWTRNSVSLGNGIYKSTDGGENWTHMGLPESERINKIVVDPRNHDVVYACVPGKLWSDSTDRGLYRTGDGGQTWSLVLKGSNPSTGCSSVTFDPRQPDVMYAGLWDFRRKGWTFRSGGENADATSGSGLFRSSDGGQHWTALEPGANGLPKAPWGRVEIEFAPSDPKIVYAFIEGVDSGLFHSADGGKSWEARDKSQFMVWRPFYFANLIVDPVDPQRVFKPNLGLIVSEDGGKSFSGSGGGAHGDWHDLWIDPTNPRHLVGGDDGGLWISMDGGNRWWKGANLPISQFYHVSVDDTDPYHVYGGLQDNSSWVGDSAYPGGITNHRWENMYGGDGFWMFSDPADPDYLYAEAQGGYIGRVNRHTLEARDIQPKANYKEKLRFNWNTPIHLSPNEKGTIYLGSQFLFRSRNQGQSWERISPDLTTQDPTKQQQEQSGGITVDNSSAEMHTTIYSISESPKDGGVIWVGTDDGNVQLTRNGGADWNNVVGRIKGLPKASWVSWVQASPHAAGTVFAAFDRHTFGDMRPYLYRSDDFGQTWTALLSADADKGVRGHVYVVRQDPVNPRVLYVGTEFGLWISIDGGAQFAAFKGNDFPSVAVRDIVVQERDRDLVVATHGRGIWIIDDLTPLRALDDRALSSEAAFLPARPQQQRFNASGGWPEGDASYSGQNPSSGAVITYFQRTRHLFGKLKIEILDADGTVIDTLPASKRRGLNRIEWAMRVKPPRVPKAAQLAGSATQGPRVLPGHYTVRMSKGGEVYETGLDIALDRRAVYSPEDRRAQFAATMRVHALFGRMTTLTERILAVREQANGQAAQQQGPTALARQLQALGAKADALRKEIVATKEGGAITGEERLREHMDQLYGALLNYEGKPGDYHLARIEALTRELEELETRFEAMAKDDVGKVNAALEKAGLAPIQVPPAAATPVAYTDADGGDARAVLGAWLRHETLPERAVFRERD